MGLMKRLAQEAERTRRRPKRRQQKRIGVDVVLTQGTLRALTQFPIELREKVLQKAVRAAGRETIIATRRNLARHRSKRTGTRQYWSDMVRKQRDHGIDLWMAMNQRVKVYDRSGNVVSMVGGRRPYANHLHLLENPHEMVYWGRREGAQWSGTVPFKTGILASKAAREHAFRQKLEKEWQNV